MRLLGLKQCLGNPWEDFQASYPVGTEIEGEIKNITEFGLFVGLPGEIDGMIHLSDLDWSRSGDEAVKDYQSRRILGSPVTYTYADYYALLPFLSPRREQGPLEVLILGLAAGNMSRLYHDFFGHRGLEIDGVEVDPGMVTVARVLPMTAMAASPRLSAWNIARRASSPRLNGFLRRTNTGRVELPSTCSHGSCAAAALARFQKLAHLLFWITAGDSSALSLVLLILPR